MTVAACLWTYQRERFPLGRTAVLVAVFSASGVSLSSVLGGRPLPGPGAYACAFAVAFLLFLQLRAADEVKDADDDRRYRPERPIPRGLVSLRLIVWIGISATFVQAAAALLYDPRLLALLAVVWSWLGLMSVEFFAPAFLRARPRLYLVSHMLIMPLIDLWITGVDWLPRAGAPPALLAWALLLSFANGCVLEVGRKIWAVERPGVETYSALWGIGPALRAWGAEVAIAFAIVLLLGLVTRALAPVAVVAAIAFAFAVRAGLAFDRDRDGAAQKRLDAASGLWVLMSYATLGLAPVLMR